MLFILMMSPAFTFQLQFQIQLPLRQFNLFRHFSLLMQFTATSVHCTKFHQDWACVNQQISIAFMHASMLSTASHHCSHAVSCHTVMPATGKVY